MQAILRILVERKNKLLEGKTESDREVNETWILWGGGWFQMGAATTKEAQFLKD